jgi:NTE family protein
LRGLLNAHLPLERIQQSIDKGFLDALCITASGYSTGESVSFFQGASHLDGWNRSRRIGIRTAISIDHLLASAAIPMLFPAVRVNREYFGDGAIRQHAPISPALHLGANRIMVIGVGNHSSEPGA